MAEEKPENVTYILQHKIKWWLDDDTITELDEADVEHITKLIIEGYDEGELNHGEKEIRGAWKISRTIKFA